MIVPFRQFLLKVHSRCNLDCDYCYVYRHADQSWRGRPAVMSAQVVDLIAARIAEHARQHRLAAIRVVLHGGEPLLAGPERIAYVAATVRRATEGVTAVQLSLQTNGVLLSADFLETFRRHHIRVGVSLDGARPAQDRHRRYASGRSSYSGVRRGLELLGQPRYRHLFGGLLCTIDLSNDPIETYEALAGFAPPRIDLLLPHATWAQPPPATGPAGRVAAGAAGIAAPYGDWLVSVFDRWYGAPRRTGIRLFEEIINLLLGGRSGSEAIGLTPVDLVVVDTDGAVEQADSLKVAFDGAPATGLNVADHPFDRAAEHPAIRARQGGLAELCATCRACPVVEVCGGGLYAHRYRAGTGFANPSVYCSDLRRLIDHIGRRLRADLRRLGPAAPVADRRLPAAAPATDREVSTTDRLVPAAAGGTGRPAPAPVSPTGATA